MSETVELTEPGAPELEIVAFRNIRTIRNDGSSWDECFKRWLAGTLSDKDRKRLHPRYDTDNDTVEVDNNNNGFGPTVRIRGTRLVDLSQLSNDARLLLKMWQRRRIWDVIKEVREATGLSLLDYRCPSEIEATRREN